MGSSEFDSLILELEGLAGPRTAPQSDPAMVDIDSEAISNLMPPRYQVRGFLGRGAMGVVYDAFDHVLHRRVAIKVLGVANRMVADMMRREREVLAALQHPGVVTIFDSGELADGRPYCVMQHVEGEDLASYATQISLGPHSIAKLMASVARSLAVVHVLGIVHRDIKPSNIRIERGDAHPVVVDFGLAKFTDEISHEPGGELGAAVYQTVVRGRAKGTLPYMSPEQAAGETVDARSDIYSLGVVMFELLTGRLPNEPASDDIRPVEWSQFIGAHSLENAWKGVKGVPRELIAITNRCLAPAASDRYRDANELADDLHAFLEHRTVNAVRTGRRLHMVRQFLRRARLPIAIGVLSLAVVMGVVMAAFVQVRGERNRAVDNARRADAHAEDAKRFLRESEVQRQTIERTADQLRARIYPSEIAQAEEYRKFHRLLEARKLLDHWHADSHESDLRTFEWRHLSQWCDTKSKTLPGGGSRITHLRFDRQGHRLASADEQGALRVWNIDTSERIFEEAGENTPVDALAISSDGRRLASASSPWTIKLWDVESGRREGVLAGLLPTTSTFDRLDFSPDGRWLGALDRPMLRVWDLSTQQVVGFTRPLPDVECFGFSENGEYLATARQGQHLEVRRLATGEVVHRYPIRSPLPCTAAAVDSSAERAAWGNDFGRVEVSRLSDDHWMAAFEVESRVESIGFRADGNLVISGANGIVREYRPDGTKVASFGIDPGQTDCVATSLERPLTAIARRDGSIVLHSHRMSPASQAREMTFDQPGVHLAVAANDWLAAVALDNGAVVHLVDLRDMSVLAFLADHDAPVSAMAFDSDGERLASVDTKGRVNVWNVSTGTLLVRPPPMLESAFSVGFTPHGDELVVGGEKWRIVRFNIQRGDWSTWDAPKSGIFVSDFAIDENDGSMVGVNWDRTMGLWKLDSDRLQAKWTGHRDVINAVAIVPPESMAVSVSNDQTIGIWSTRDGRELGMLMSRGFAVRDVAVSFDGRTLATAHESIGVPGRGYVQLWNTRTRQPTIALELADSCRWNRVSFAAHDRCLVALGAKGAQGVLAVWEIEDVSR